MELFFDEGPHGEFDEDGEDDDADAEVADKIEDDEEEVYDGADYGYVK